VDCVGQADNGCFVRLAYMKMVVDTICNENVVDVNCGCAVHGVYYVQVCRNELVCADQAFEFNPQGGCLKYVDVYTSACRVRCSCCG
jgi:hypothetical protein